MTTVDIRTDYISSGAVFSLEVRFASNKGNQAAMHLAVSGESCSSVDGKMQADVIYLYPEQRANDILVGSRSIYSATNLDDLCDMLFDAATVKGWKDPMAEYNQYASKVNGLTFAIDGKLRFYDSHKELSKRIEKMGGKVSPSVSSGIDYLICNNRDSVSRKASKARELGIPILSDMDFAFGLFGNKPGEEEDCTDEGATVSVRDVAPITIGNFKNVCAEAGLTFTNLSISPFKITSLATGTARCSFSATMTNSRNIRNVTKPHRRKKKSRSKKHSFLL